MKAAERWSEHTKSLTPLKVGDMVRIQNQTGNFPTKWDKTGCVVEVRQFDQCVVRVDVSGRVTLRNRKFLRKYVPVIQREQLRTILEVPSSNIPIGSQSPETVEGSTTGYEHPNTTQEP